MRNYFPDPSGFSDYVKSTPEYTEAVKKFAVKLHQTTCPYNHMDACSWYYEEDNWDKWTHEKFFNKAKELLSSGVPEDAILDIIHVARSW